MRYINLHFTYLLYFTLLTNPSPSLKHKLTHCHVLSDCDCLRIAL